ncbi:MAG: hypothetical protein IJ587_06005 [Synergistaceae bacterium]|nr:hypothetical protein [Synergistaceae bacterium]
MSVTRTPAGVEVSEELLTERVMRIREVKDFRLEQLGRNSYRILILPRRDADVRGIKGSVLDALVDIYGMKCEFDIDITSDDPVILPEGERAVISAQK